MTYAVIIDGNHTARRNWRTTGHLQTRSGKPSGVMHGTLGSICHLVDRFQPQYVFVAWDRRSRHRERLLANYRAKLETAGNPLLDATPRRYKESRYEDRTNADHIAFQEDLLPQLQDLQYLMPHLGIRSLCVDGVEGDDLIGIAADILSRHGETIIVSTDHDLFQLLNENTSMYDPIKKKQYTIKDFEREYLIEANQWPEVKALMGDESDDIPGIPKIGKKRAVDLICHHENIHGVIEKCQTDPDKTWMTRIPEYLPQIEFAYEMSYILSSPDDLEPDQRAAFLKQWDAPAVVNWDEVSQMCDRYELRAANVELKRVIGVKTDEANVSQCKTIDELFTYWGDCRRCPLWENRINIVKYGGSPTAKIALCGEGPGSSENIRGEPFIGKAGKYLDTACLKPNGLSRDDLHILNTVCCRPTDENGDNRAPTTQEMEACNPRLKAQIRIVDPRVVVLIGDKALKAFFPDAGKIGQERGADTPREHPDFPGIKFVAVFHPSYLMRLRPTHSHVIKSRTDWKYIRKMADELTDI